MTKEELNNVFDKIQRGNIYLNDVVGYSYLYMTENHWKELREKFVDSVNNVLTQ